MSRQIKTDIFGDSPSSGGYGASVIPAPQNLEPILESLQDTKDTGPLYDDLLGRIEKLRYQTQESLNSINLKFEKIGQSFATIESRMKQGTVENHERLANIASRIKDRNTSDLKVEALIERHNQIVQSFELRISQAQRLIENQSL